MNEATEPCIKVGGSLQGIAADILIFGYQDPIALGDLRDPLDIGHVSAKVVQMNLDLRAGSAKRFGHLVAADLMVKKEG